jgi:hypothetical protein
VGAHAGILPDLHLVATAAPRRRPSASSPHC